MDCPDCGKPMKVKRLKNNVRVWTCTNDYGRDACYGTVPIDGDEQLSIGTMAEGMARAAFTDSSEHAKKQSSYRRIAGSLGKLRVGQEYLSDTELRTLDDAAAILQRLGDAAEKAKKVKKRLEQEEEARRTKRAAEACQLLDARYESDKLVTWAGNILTLYRLQPGYNLEPIRLDDLERLTRDAASPITRAIRNFLFRAYRDVRDELVSHIVYEKRPVDELVAIVVEKFPTAPLTAQDRAVLDTIEQLVQVEETENVERLQVPR